MSVGKLLNRVQYSFDFAARQSFNVSRFATDQADYFINSFLMLNFAAWKYNDKLTGVLGCKDFGLYVETANKKIILTDLISQKAIIKRDEKKKRLKP